MVTTAVLLSLTLRMKQMKNVSPKVDPRVSSEDQHKCYYYCLQIYLRHLRVTKRHITTTCVLTFRRTTQEKVPTFYVGNYTEKRILKHHARSSLLLLLPVSTFLRK